jgi:hypothetical protein
MKRFARDEGQITSFIVFLAFALIMCAGLVVDGGRLFAANREARNAAAGAARDGAQALDITTFRQASATTLSVSNAETRAQAFLRAAGYTGDVMVTGDAVTVTINTQVPMLMLGVVGVGPRAITVTETARAVRGP